MKWRNNNVRDVRKLLFGKWWSFCAGGFEPGTLAVSYIHTYALKSPYQKAHCGNCHDLIAFLILHLITHFTEETVCQTCPMRNINLVYRGEYLVSGWKICDLDLEDTHYKSPQTHERQNSLYQTLLIFPQSVCIWTFEWHHWIFATTAGHCFEPPLMWVFRAARVFSVSLTEGETSPWNNYIFIMWLRVTFQRLLWENWQSKYSLSCFHDE